MSCHGLLDHRGIDKEADVPVPFPKIELDITAKTDMDPATLEDFKVELEQRCPMSVILRQAGSPKLSRTGHSSRWQQNDHRRTHPYALSRRQRKGWPDRFKPDSVPYQRDMSPESKEQDHAQFPELKIMFNQVERRLADMARMGVDRQVIAPAPGQQHYWAEPSLLAEISALQNDHVAELVAKAPDRFVGLGTLPMTDPDAAVAEIGTRHAGSWPARLPDRQPGDGAGTLRCLA
jgi:hypothetical protein